MSFDGKFALKGIYSRRVLIKMSSKLRSYIQIKMRFYSITFKFFGIIFGLCLLCCSVKAEKRPNSLWLSAYNEVNLLKESTLSQPVQRVIVPVLADGKAPFGSGVEIFNHEPIEAADSLPAFIKQAHAKNIQVYAAIDCLCWVAPDTPEDEGIFARYPELAEREEYGGYGNSYRGRFASPFHPRVKAILHDFVAEVATRYPELDGLVLQFRLPLGSPLLAYSEAAREAAQQAIFVDPLNINLGGNEQDQQDAKRWVEWRLSETTALVNDLARTFREKKPGAPVATVGFARWNSLKPGKKNTTLEDWPAWSQTGSTDEVLLQDNWDEVAPDTFARAKAQLQNAPRPVTASALVSAAQIATDLDLKRTAQALAANTPVVLSIQTPADLARATQFWAALSAPAIIEIPPNVAIAPVTTAKLALGEAAPDFTAVDMNGRTVRLSNFQGQKNVLLTFFPKCFTSGCERHLESLQAHRAEFDATNTQIIAVSVDPAPTQRAFADMLGLSFAMLPDTQHQIISLYGGFDETSGLSKRQSVFIDKSGIVRLIDHDVQPATHGADMLAAIKKLTLQ